MTNKIKEECCGDSLDDVCISCREKQFAENKKNVLTMHIKMQEIFNFFKIEIDSDERNYFIGEQQEDFNRFDYSGLVSISMVKRDDTGKWESDCPQISFFEGCPQTFAAYLARKLTLEGIKYEVYENIYEKFDENDEFVELLFGEDAEREYKKEICKEMSIKWN